MYVGYMGGVVFISSSDYMITPSNFSESGAARWADHDVIHQKPVSEFIGPGLEEISFDIILSAQNGINPDDQIKTLRKMRDVGAVFPLIIGGKPVSQNYWRLESISDGNNYYTSTGKRIWTTVSVKLKEYYDKNYKEEKSKISLYGNIGNGIASIFGGM